MNDVPVFNPGCNASGVEAFKGGKMDIPRKVTPLFLAKLTHHS